MLEPRADGFRSYIQEGEKLAPETLLLDNATLLTLTAPEMTVLVGGMRVLGTNVGGTSYGVFTDRPGVLSNDFFVNLLDMGTEWSTSSTEHVYEGKDRSSGAVRWTATAIDLVFGSHSVLRGIAEVYASSDGGQRFAKALGDLFLALDQPISFRLDRGKLLRRRHSVGRALLDPQRLMRLQAGDADHEEFVEIAGGDRKEAQPLQEGVFRVARLLQHAPVEGEPAQLPIEIALLRSRRQLGRNVCGRDRQLRFCGSGHSPCTCCCHGAAL